MYHCRSCHLECTITVP